MENPYVECVNNTPFTLAAGSVQLISVTHRRPALWRRLWAKATGRTWSYEVAYVFNANAPQDKAD